MQLGRPSKKCKRKIGGGGGPTGITISGFLLEASRQIQKISYENVTIMGRVVGGGKPVVVKSQI